MAVPKLRSTAPRLSSPAARPPAEEAEPAAGALPIAALAGALGDDEPTPAPRRARDDDGKGESLTKYFREMSELAVLKPEEEFAHARRIEALEIALWTELLAHGPTIGFVLARVEGSLDNALPEFRALRRLAGDGGALTAASKQRAVAQRAAAKLRALDTDRLHMEALLAEVRRAVRAAPPVGSRRKKPAATDRAAWPTAAAAGVRAWIARVEAADRAAAGARDAFVLANLRLVVSIARRFNHGRMALADLIQEGNLGLIKAVERYDYTRGFRFSTYASWWIRHAISRALADKGREVRLPVHMIDAYHRLSKARRELGASLGRQPTSEELSRATDIAVGKIERMRTYLADQSVSLDKPIGDAEGRSLLEVLVDDEDDALPPADRMALDQMTAEVQRLLGDLKPIEQDILRQRFGFDDDQELTLKEIGEKYKLSRERIRQLQEQALDKMRRALGHHSIA